MSARLPLEIFKWYTRTGYPPKNAPVYDCHPNPLERAMGTHKIQGDRHTGKSALGETICYLFLKTGAAVYDIYAANDNENAAWLNSPWASKVTLLVGSNCKLDFKYKQYNYMRAIDVDPRFTKSQTIFVACKAFFQEEDDYYRAMWSLSDKFKTRTSYKDSGVHVVFMREAQEVVTGVQRVGIARSERDATAAFIRFHNTLFHFGYAIVLDSQRDVEVSKSVRELADWNYFKNMGGMEIPRKYWHTFPDVDPDRIYRELEPWQFIIYAKNKVGLGRFKMPPWHIDRGRDVLTDLGVSARFPTSLTQTVTIPALAGTAGGPGRPKELALRAKIRELVLAGKSYSQIEGELHTSNVTITKVKNEMRAEGLKV